MQYDFLTLVTWAQGSLPRHRACSLEEHRREVGELPLRACHSVGLAFKAWFYVVLRTGGPLIHGC